MTSTDYDFIVEDFLSAFYGTSSDNRYVLRKMLLRGVREAEFRCFVCDGDKARKYRGLMLELESVVDSLDVILDAAEGVSEENRILLTESVMASRRLIDLNQAEVMGDYANIVEILTKSLSDDYRQQALAA